MTWKSAENMVASSHCLEALLKSSFLKSGPNRIRDCGREEVGGLTVSLFVATSHCFSSEITELIALELTDGARSSRQPPLEELVPFLVRMAEKHNASEVWHISQHISDSITIREQRPRIVSINISGVFCKILPLPDDPFPCWIREASTVDSSTFTAFYQKRAAAALDLPYPKSRRFLAQVDRELAQWAAARTPERPLLLLGDRGSGKTWQLLRFCQEQQFRHKEAPWLSPPAIYFSLRGVSSYLADDRVSSFGLYALLAQRYSWFEVKWDVTMLQALLKSGHLIICLDGLDEFGVDAPDEGVGNHLAHIFGLLPRGSRFILSCRTTHFSSFAELASLETWPGSRVTGTMRILQMLPFGTTELDKYVDVVPNIASDESTAERLRGLIHVTASSSAAIQALQRCAQEPAILSRLVAELMDGSQKTDLQLLRSALEDSLISFNLEAERTHPVHMDAEGNIRAFGTRERVALLGELAWFMAERNLNSIDLEKIPKRIALMFGITSKALQRDIRSQTVFELDEPRPDNMSEGMQSDESDSSRVRFGFRLGTGTNNRDGREAGQAYPEPGGSRVGLSVANAYFLAGHIARRLGDQFTIPGVRLHNVLQYLGRVRLDDLTTAILRQQLDTGGVVGYNAAKLRMDIRQVVCRLAAEGDYKVFDSSFRYLVANAVRMGALSETEGAEIDPWPPEIAACFLSPEPIPDYELVLVPPYDAGWRQRRIASTVSDENEGKPFLIGLHEITNEQFYNFVRTPSGSDWSVERIRRSALEEGIQSRSPKAMLTNEYHLYFWVQPYIAGEGAFAPSKWYLRHPVVYVSLYAAEAFCTWLNESSEPSSTSSPYRLPTAAEWRWAAQAGYENAKYPWELVPYPIDLPDPSTRHSESDSNLSAETDDVANWLRNYRSAAADVLLDARKRSSEVGLDEELSPHGVMGLIGNVKEWVRDRVSESQDPAGKWKGMVCGGTAQLGLGSFLFGYYATLYPENTNPDVGFRIARSLSPEELRALTVRQTELAALEAE